MHAEGFLMILTVSCLTTLTKGAPAFICPNLNDGTPQYFDESDGECHACLTCDVGFGLSEICGDGYGKDAQCQGCQPGYFSANVDWNTCMSCHICDNTMQDTIPCTAWTDRKCGPCQYGYFRHNERDDHCVSCDDELYNYNYPDCQRTTLPAILDEAITERDAITFGDYRTSLPMKTPKDLLSRGTKILIIIVVVGVSVIIIVWVIIKYTSCPPKCIRSGGWCQRKPSPTPTASNAQDSHADERDGNQTEMETLIRRVDVPDPAEVQRQTAQPQQAVPCPPDPVTPEDESDRSHEGQGIVEGATSGDEAGNSMATDSDGDRLDEGRRDSGTQTTPPDCQPPPAQMDTNENAKLFKEKLEKAILLNTEVALSEMNTADFTLLDRLLYEKAQLAENCADVAFNFISLAKLYGINQMMRKQCDSASHVIQHISNTDKTHPSAADFLRKLAESGQCNDVVRQLVNQIIKREEERDS